MAFTARAAARAVTGFCALLALAWLAGCDSALGTSAPHAAPANPNAEGGDGEVELTWRAVTDATRYVILWDSSPGNPTYENEIKNIEGTSYVHTGLTNLQVYHYKIAAETGGGRGPESLPVRAIPGPVPGPVEWTAVTTQDPGHTIYFADRGQRNPLPRVLRRPRVAARRPPAERELRAGGWLALRATDGHGRHAGLLPRDRHERLAHRHGRPGRPLADERHQRARPHDCRRAFGRVNDDNCIDLPTAGGGVDTGVCTGAYSARVLADAGLTDLVANPRHVSDVRFADFNGDGFDDMFSNTESQFSNAGSFALLHMNQGDGNYQTSASISALGIRGVGGTLLAADFDNDGDVDLFAPYDQSNGDGARNWLLINNGNGVFHDTAAAAGVENNPTGAAYIPRGGQAVDFDEDGFVDLIFGARLMLNNGDGTFRDGSAAAHMPKPRGQRPQADRRGPRRRPRPHPPHRLDHAPVPQHGRRLRRRRARRRDRRQPPSASAWLPATSTTTASRT